MINIRLYTALKAIIITLIGIIVIITVIAIKLYQNGRADYNRYSEELYQIEVLEDKMEALEKELRIKFVRDGWSYKIIKK